MTSTGFTIVSLNDLVYCEGDSNYTVLYFQNGTSLHVAKLLTYFEDLIRDTDHIFYRVHRSYLINIEYIHEYRNCRSRKVVLTNQVEIPVSNRKAKEFCDLMRTVFSCMA